MQILQGSKYCSAKFWFWSSCPFMETNFHENIQSTIAKVICLVGQNTSHTKRKSDTSYVKPCKVWIFWERYKIWENLPLKIWHYSVMSNFKWKIFQILWPSQNIRTLNTWKVGKSAKNAQSFSTLFMPTTFMYVHGLFQKRARAQIGSKYFW